MFLDENPLFLGEYHQVFKSSSFFSRFWLYKRIQKTNVAKRAGANSISSQILKNIF